MARFARNRHAAIATAPEKIEPTAERVGEESYPTSVLTSRGSAARPFLMTARIARDHDSNPRLQQPLVRKPCSGTVGSVGHLGPGFLGV